MTHFLQEEHTYSSKTKPPNSATPYGPNIQTHESMGAKSIQTTTETNAGAGPNLIAVEAFLKLQILAWVQRAGSTRRTFIEILNMEFKTESSTQMSSTIPGEVGHSSEIGARI